MDFLVWFFMASIGIGVTVTSALDYVILESAVNVTGVPPMADRTNETEGRIVGGTPAAAGAYPWFARSSIDFFEGSFYVTSGTCGASLIHPRVAVSAMHCIDKVLPPTGYNWQATLYFGANAFSGSDAMAVRNVQRIVYILEYNFPHNDIVLYTWDTPITNIVPIAFNRVTELPSFGSIARAIGFGRTVNGGPQSPILLQVDLNVVAASVCNNAYGITLSESELVCVQTPGKGTCQGDSGGPLFATTSGVLTLFGITSFGGTCGASPSGYTATSHFQTFIDDFVCGQIGGGYCDNPPTPTPPTPSPPSGGGICFSANSKVSVLGRGDIPIASLQIGDYVQTAVDKHSRVFSLLHAADWVHEIFVQVTTEHNLVLEVSMDHFLHVCSTENKKVDCSKVRAAQSIQVNDYLSTIHGPSRVVSLERVMSKGLYAPATFQGDIVVNGIVASNYVQLIDSNIPFQNSILHMSLSPLRLSCRFAFQTICQQETYSAMSGLSNYIAWFVALVAMVGQLHPILQGFVTICYLPIAVFMWMMDSLVGLLGPTLFVGIVMACYSWIKFSTSTALGNTKSNNKQKLE